MIIKQPHHRIRLIKVLLSISFNLYRHIFLKKINANNMIKKIGTKPIKSSNVIRKNPSSEPPPSVAPICMVSDTPAGTTIYPVVSKIMSVFSKLHSFLIEAPPLQILIYRSVLSPVSPLYYKGTWQSPYLYSSAYNSS